MPAKPIDVDRPPGSSLLAELNMQLPNVAMYAFLSLCLTLPAARYCWQKLFDHPSVNQSALRMLMLKGLFVVQTVILGALANDMIFQLAFNRKALPKAAAMWMTPASMVAGAVLWATKSGQMMVNHTVQSLSIAAVPAMVLLHTKFSPMPSLTLVINILAVYLVSQLAVYWEDIKHYLHRHHTDFPLKFFGTQALTDDHETPAKAHGHVPSTDYTNPAHISGDSADQLHEEYKDGKGRRGRRSGSRGSKGGSRGSGRRRSTVSQRK
ncbi:hypothetical protein RvY_12152 [Ramazzottius varieornatus]|uniref:Uncharacterized protein n=1 Tax=Ramazzottius varieornatus TaxID=947166 RepID=A0A1D1VSB1_RAMVA|nr:hypothetical protein RvY_12152 [Ramazzottius varieornatus]